MGVSQCESIPICLPTNLGNVYIILLLSYVQMMTGGMKGEVGWVTIATVAVGIRIRIYTDCRNTLSLLSRYVHFSCCPVVSPEN